MTAARNENYFLLRLTATVKTIIADTNGMSDTATPVLGFSSASAGTTIGFQTLFQPYGSILFSWSKA